MENKNQELTDRKNLESIERNLQRLEGKVGGWSSWDIKTLELLADFLSVMHDARMRTYKLRMLIENKEIGQECFCLKRIADSIDRPFRDDDDIPDRGKRIEKKKRLKEVEEIEEKIMVFFENGGEESDEVCRRLKRIEKKLRQIIDVSAASVKARKEAREKEELLRNLKKNKK